MTPYRLEKLSQNLKSAGIDAILVTKKENIFYLTEFDRDAVLLATAGGRRYLITDERFAQHAFLKIKDIADIQITNGSRNRMLKKTLFKEKVKRLGFESEYISYDEAKNLNSEVRNIKLVPQKNLVEDMRLIKDDRELAFIKNAVSILKKTFAYIKSEIGPDMTDENLSAEIDSFMRLHGSSGSAFKTIVTAGANSSHPHGMISKERFSGIGPVLVDTGCVYQGYHSDLTRVFFLGRISRKFKAIYNAVKLAQEKAIKKIRPGVKISLIDRQAREYIASKGLGKNFIHSLGHGIGLEIHERPTISRKNNSFLRTGMVFTVEPGVYIPGLGGIRLEDMVVVTDKGCQVLTEEIPK